MENKKTFGAYILQRRRELGMTQKELAEKLYVTESAVSKWERGLSYPDITLLQNLCALLFTIYRIGSRVEKVKNTRRIWNSTVRKVLVFTGVLGYSVFSYTFIEKAPAG